MKKSLLLFVTILSFGLVITSCKKNDQPETDCENFHWSYSGDEGPQYWSGCYVDCGGEKQSPIDITGAVAASELTDLETHYQSAPLELINNGHSIEFEYASGSVLTLDGLDYELLQLHFHTQSEHTLNGNYYPMEVHLVHKNEASGALAVVGIFFEEGAENAFLQEFMNDLPESEGDHFSSDLMLNAQDLYPESKGYYTYSGSLTTPPCSEIVTWFVFSEPIKASGDQLAKLHSLIHDNYRPVQALNGREVRLHQ